LFLSKACGVCVCVWGRGDALQLSGSGSFS
jgi:hypothetical protein